MWHRASLDETLSQQGEIKLSVTIEDEANKDLPSAVQLFRPIRQYVYGVLFSLAESRKKAERLAVRKNCLPECESRSLASLCHVFFFFFFESLRGGNELARDIQPDIKSVPSPSCRNRLLSDVSRLHKGVLVCQQTFVLRFSWGGEI